MPQIQGPLPTLLHSTTPVSLKVAQNWLSSYSTQAASRPHLHPNSTFTPERLEFSSHGPEGGITLHLLRRIQAGLNGEVLEPLKEDPEGDDRVLDSQITPMKKGSWNESDNRAGKRKDMTTDADWEDPEKFALAQGEEDDVGEIGEGSNFVQEVSEEPEVHADGQEAAGSSKPVSKGDRKAAKKAKRQAEKREKNEKAKKQKMNHGSDEEYI
jgi:hypothetical protein